MIIGIKPSSIPDLPTGFGIKRRVIKNNFACFASRKLLRSLPVVNNGQHLAAVRASLPIAFKFRCRQLLISGIGRLLGRAFPGSARTSLLFLHRVIETSLIKTQTLIAGRILHEVEWHAKRIVEFERVLARELVRRALEQRLQFSQTHIHGVRETSFFENHGLRNSVGCLFQLRICILHQVAHREHHLMKERLRLPEQPSVRNRPPNDLPQYVPTAVIGFYSTPSEIRNVAAREWSAITRSEAADFVWASLLNSLVSDVPVNSAALLISGTNRSVS